MKRFRNNAKKDGIWGELGRNLIYILELYNLDHAFVLEDQKTVEILLIQFNKHYEKCLSLREILTPLIKKNSRYNFFEIQL